MTAPLLALMVAYTSPTCGQLRAEFPHALRAYNREVARHETDPAEYENSPAVLRMQQLSADLETYCHKE